MHDSIYSAQLTRSRRARLLAVATLASGVLVAGCGGGSSNNPTATTVRGTSLPASSRTGEGAASPRSTTHSTGGSGPIAFARCMRADGVPNFPDPKSGGGALFAVPAGADPAAPAFRAAQAKCQKLMGGGPPGPGSTTHPSARTLARLLRIAQCMREHGVPNFPDPRTSVPSNTDGFREITDFDGAILLFPSTINLQAPAYKRALTACGAPPLGLAH